MDMETQFEHEIDYDFVCEEMDKTEGQRIYHYPGTDWRNIDM
jgi:hypothetical protein